MVYNGETQNGDHPILDNRMILTIDDNENELKKKKKKNKDRGKKRKKKAKKI